MMVIESKYEIGETVYLITDKEQAARLVTGFIVRKTALIYELSCGANSSTHYDFEISLEPNVVLTSTN